MSTRTVPAKLLIKPDTTLWLSHPERGGLLAPLPSGVVLADSPERAAVALVFADDAASLRAVLSEHAEGMTRAGVIWVAYPKGNVTDINRDTLWPMLAEHGLRPISQIAIDNVWSALRFRPLKDGEAQFSGGKTKAAT